MIDPVGAIGAAYTILRDLAKQRRNADDATDKGDPQKRPTNKLRPTLPHPIGFIPRPDLLHRILRPPPATASVSGFPIAAICLLHGVGGIGKTEMARAVARELKPKNGVAEVNLRGWDSGQPMTEDEALRSLCAQSTSAPDKDATLETLQSHWRSATADDYVVVILDNLQDPALIDSLRPSSGLTIVTSRESLHRNGVQAIRVAEMELPEAVALAKANLMAVEDSQAEALANVVGRLPLAIEVAAGHLAESGEGVEQLVQRIGEASEGEAKPEERTLEGLFRRVVSLSVDDLADGQVARWHALALPPADFGLWTVKAMWQDEDPVPELTRLTRRNLLTRQEGEQRWRMHDLLRHYGRAALSSDIDQEQALWRRLGPAALERLCEIDKRYKNRGTAAVLALTELDGELPLLREANSWSRKNYRRDRFASEMVKKLPSYAEILTMRLHNNEYAAWLRTQFLEQKRNGEDIDIAKSAGNLGFMYRRQERYSRAFALTTRGLRVFEKLQNRLGQTNCLVALGLMHCDLENFEKSKDIFFECLENYKKLNINDTKLKKERIAQVLGNLGLLYKDWGKEQISKKYFQDCIRK